MKSSKLFLVAFISAMFLASCSKDEIEVPRYNSKGIYDSGVLIINQGNSAGSSISNISFDLATVNNDIFNLANPSVPFGVYAQDMIFNGDKAYTTMGGSNKIQIFNRYTMLSLGSISNNLKNPRYMIIANNKLYVSNFGNYDPDNSDDFISVFDVNTNAFLKTIAVSGGSADKMIWNAGKLYVAQGGDSGTGNNIKVIDTTTDTVIKTILVSGNPNALEISNGALWVMCTGYSSYPNPANESNGILVKLNLATDALIIAYSFPAIYTTPTSGAPVQIFEHPKNFVVNSGYGYYTINSKMYKVNLSPTTTVVLPGNVIVTNAGTAPNAIAIRNDKIFVADATDYNSGGFVSIYSLGVYTDSPALGTLLKTKTVGIAPSGFYFN